MSIYKSKRSESSMQFVDTAKKLEAFTLSCCMKAPKRYTFFLTSRIMQLASDVHEHAAAANNIWPTNQHEAQMRRDELTRANIALQNLDPKLQLLYEAARQNPEGCKCLQAHTSQESWTPEDSPSLWVCISDPAEEWPEWSQPAGSTDAYGKGAKVSHNGKRWTSDLDANVWEPGVANWTEVTDG